MGEYMGLTVINESWLRIDIFRLIQRMFIKNNGESIDQHGFNDHIPSMIK